VWPPLQALLSRVSGFAAALVRWCSFLSVRALDGATRRPRISYRMSCRWSIDLMRRTTCAVVVASSVLDDGARDRIGMPWLILVRIDLATTSVGCLGSIAHVQVLWCKFYAQTRAVPELIFKENVSLPIGRGLGLSQMEQR
jgi:hypothetical protein